MSEKINLTLKVWRQENTNVNGDFVSYDVSDVNPHMSFLELLDVLNERLISDGGDPIAFEHDCREGICGSCAMTINGEAHGPVKSTTACQLHMFNFKDGDTITVEPWRASSFPILKDLVTDRSAFDRIIQSGGYVSVNTGSAPDGNAIPIEKDKAIEAFKTADELEEMFGGRKTNPSRIYIPRCEHYLENPPGEDWDGVFVATSK